MELRLKNVTSYNKKDFATLNLNSKINIVYGQNGAGKSTISNYFYNKDDQCFSECECSSIENHRTIVYNSKFVEDNFYKKNEQKGIFTLSKENAGIEKEILEKDERKQELLNQHKVKKENIAIIQSATKQAEDTCIEVVWSKTESTRTSPLRGLMRGSLGSKKDFYLKIKNLPPLPGIDLNALSTEYAELLKHQNNELTPISPFASQYLSEEKILLLQTPIIDTSNSYLSETIKKLDNLDWVKKGKDLYLQGNTCPFCQESTISAQFTNAIKSIFDESYSNKVNQIKFIKSIFESIHNVQLDNLKTEINKCEMLSDVEKEKSIAHITILEGISKRNLDLIKSKELNPSIVVTLECDSETEKSLTASIETYNKKITDINEKVKRFKKTESEIKGKMWAGLRELCSSEYNSFNEIEENNKTDIIKIAGEMAEIVVKGKEVGKEIKGLRDQVSNISGTIESINARLKTLGIHGFSIEKHAEIENSYIISRPENAENTSVYRSLSEGEKTLITFLYFIECCKGKTDKDDEDNREVLVVIDDPISSLSQNYIYDIASMIHFEIMQDAKIKKTLILTHNLYFFHELIKLAPKSKGDKTFRRDYSLTRITKNEFSIFSKIEKNSIQNEYQSLWQILKDAKEGKAHRILIPNIMRNILEYYFGFVHKTDELQAALNNLARDDEHSDFRPFYRFINRGSHSDAVNVTDMGEIAPEVYIGQLRKIFSLLGDELHYIKMIDEKEDEEEVATA